MKQSLNEFEFKQIYGTEQISKMTRWKQQSHFPLLFGGVCPQTHFFPAAQHLPQRAVGPSASVQRFALVLGSCGDIAPNGQAVQSHPFGPQHGSSVRGEGTCQDISFPQSSVPVQLTRVSHSSMYRGGRESSEPARGQKFFHGKTEVPAPYILICKSLLEKEF